MAVQNGGGGQEEREAEKDSGLVPIEQALLLGNTLHRDPVQPGLQGGEEHLQERGGRLERVPCCRVR